MGKIWLTTSDNRLIHLDVQGDDVNDPDTAKQLPVSVALISGLNRCWSNPIQIISPIYGSITIDLMQNSGLTGSCNQCGMCCGHPVADCIGGPHSPIPCGLILNTDIDWHVCQYLDIRNRNKWGDPNNSECTVYSNLLNVFKGCAYPPLHIHPWMTGCGYTVT